MNKSTYTYKGNVTIKVKKRPPVKKKNNGTQHLFDALYNIMAQKIPSDSTLLYSILPAYYSIVRYPSNTENTEKRENFINTIVGGNYSEVSNFSYNSGTESTEVILTRIPITNREFRGTLGVRYTGMLNHSNLLLNQLSSENVLSGFVLLLDGSGEKILAYSELQFEELKEVADDSYGQAAIYWDMSISNNVEEDDINGKQLS